jgi:hypothetical protein
MVSVVGLSGCASTGTFAPQDSPVPPMTAGQVALRYTEDLVAGDYPMARELVAPASLHAFDIINNHGANRTGTAQNLAVGSVRVKGTNADVTLTGRLCQTLSNGQQGCVRNALRHSANPIFHVHLARVGTAWRVTYRPPPGTHSASH